MLYFLLFQIENNEDEEKVNDGKLKFEQFDILTVLEQGEKLLGSAGDEFDMEEDSALEGNHCKFYFHNNNLSRNEYYQERRAFLVWVTNNV